MNSERPGKAGPTTTQSLYAWSRAVTPASSRHRSDEPRRRRLAKKSELAEQPSPLDIKRTQAEIQSVAARLVMTRHKAERLRESTVLGDTHQAEISSAAAAAIAEIAGAALEKEILQAIAADLGDLQIEALRVTQ